MASTKSTMTPDFEVKLLLNPSTVLDPVTHDIVPAILSNFSIADGSAPTLMNIAFLDTPSKEIYAAGWSPRIRRNGDKPKNFQLTYKKRYPIPDGSHDFDATLLLARDAGFDASESDYEAQVEWGYQKLTLSISRSKKEKATGFDGIELPDLETATKMAIDKAPGKFTNWGGVDGWGADALARSRIFGPVLAKRWTGTWDGDDLDIEVWPIKTADGAGIEYIAEASFKVERADDADRKHKALMEVMKGKGWFLEGDSLKTALIMDRY
ncbi:hypothetical protein B0H66DRAFT_565686 [Apodospora peruviana]|uniref:CYTH domain-containing protein n=1 Tax=Apodospora peruviana TaxID=516989 RepID=A0AAE0HZ71_9PEZI|nr:hypothetical protein B0H66DRAFT_565686 [Apodospora peruviana]